MRPAAFFIAALFLPVVRPVAAQEPPPVQVGERVRVWTSLRRVGTFGTLSRWHADSLAVSSSGEETWIPLTSVTRLEVRRAKYSRRATVALGAGAGLVVGALGGAGLGALGHCSDQTVCSQGGAAVGAVIFGGTGLVLGAVFGWFFNVHSWQEVPLDQLEVSFVTPPAGEVGLGLSVRF